MAFTIRPSHRAAASGAGGGEKGESMIPHGLLSQYRFRTFFCVLALLLAPVAAHAQAVIQRIDIEGAQRIEPTTVLSYMTIGAGQSYDPQSADASLKTLFATGLFDDVRMSWDGATLTVHIKENPIINRIGFEGNSDISQKDLEKEIQVKPRTVFTRTKVQADVQRILELYRRRGRFAATVDPKIVQRPQNRVDLVYEIGEGPLTGIARINFIGNKVFSDSELRDELVTVESAWWRILSSNDNYDPDRLTFDREQLRRFYLRRGYADFRVVSAVAELTPDRSKFFITFTVEEGDLYQFGDVEIVSQIKELDPATLRPLVPIRKGDEYNGELIEKAIDAMSFAAGTKGFAFANIRPRINRDRDNRVINVAFRVEEGPRVYIDRINIVGNSTTLDKVIRREIRVAEGDAFNRVLIDRSRTRIRSLGFFKDVTIEQEPGSAPDRTSLTVKVEEDATGELSLGAGFSSTDAFVLEFSYTQRNLFGRGQFLRTRVSFSNRQQQFEFRFTEPYFLDRPLSAGIDLYKVVNDFREADYESDTTAFGLRFGFPVSEYGFVQTRYTYRIDDLTANFAAPLQVQLAAGTASSSLIGFTYLYDTRDDAIKPTKGVVFNIGQDLAGMGGNLKYLRTEGTFSYYEKLFFDDLVGKWSVNAGYITGYDGQDVRINERFFKGGPSFRGFEVAGIGPRDTVQSSGGAIGGELYAIGTLEIRLPDVLPEDYGITAAIFSDVGTLGIVGSVVPVCTAVSCIVDDLSIRASAGLTFGWKSPFGPIQVDLGQAILKEDYDKTQIFRFGATTKF